MSIKLKEKNIRDDKSVYQFSCDICKKHLGSTVVNTDDNEPDYPQNAYNPNDILDGLIIVLNGEIYESKYQCLCADCLNKYLSDIKNALAKLNIKEM